MITSGWMKDGGEVVDDDGDDDGDDDDERPHSRVMTFHSRPQAPAAAFHCHLGLRIPPAPRTESSRITSINSPRS